MFTLPANCKPASISVTRALIQSRVLFLVIYFVQPGAKKFVEVRQVPKGISFRVNGFSGLSILSSLSIALEVVQKLLVVNAEHALDQGAESGKGGRAIFKGNLIESS